AVRSMDKAIKNSKRASQLSLLDEGSAEHTRLAAEIKALDLTGHEEHQAAGAYHSIVEVLALACGSLGLLFAYLMYYRRVLKPEDAKNQFPGLHRFLTHKWYFDELYSVALVRPALAVAGWCRGFDLRFIDGFIDSLGTLTVRVSHWNGTFDLGVIDGL